MNDMKWLWGTVAATMLMGFFYAGVSWNIINAMADDIAKAQIHPVHRAEVEVMKVKQDAIVRDVSEIKADVKVLDDKIDQILHAVKK